jgi:hypothetical protein
MTCEHCDSQSAYISAVSVPLQMRVHKFNRSLCVPLRRDLHFNTRRHRPTLLTSNTMAELFRSTQWQALIHSKPLAAGLGLVSHFVLNNGEWDHTAHLVAVFWIVAFSALGTVSYILDPSVQSIIGALRIVSTAAAVYFGSLVTSILIYRAFFHRLRKV